jgi:hypothetical protein
MAQVVECLPRNFKVPEFKLVPPKKEKNDGMRV